MIQITPQMRIMVAIEPVDFRCGIDGLCAICRKVLKADPFSGYLFVFRNRAGTSIKIITYDGQGFWLCQKRLSSGRFLRWPDKINLLAHELQMLTWNGDPDTAVAPFWKQLGQ